MCPPVEVALIQCATVADGRPIGGLGVRGGPAPVEWRRGRKDRLLVSYSGAVVVSVGGALSVCIRSPSPHLKSRLPSFLEGE